MESGAGKKTGSGDLIRKANLYLLYIPFQVTHIPTLITLKKSKKGQKTSLFMKNKLFEDKQISMCLSSMFLELESELVFRVKIFEPVKK